MSVSTSDMTMKRLYWGQNNVFQGKRKTVCVSRPSYYEKERGEGRKPTLSQGESIRGGTTLKKAYLLKKKKVKFAHRR